MSEVNARTVAPLARSRKGERRHEGSEECDSNHESSRGVIVVALLSGIEPVAHLRLDWR
jgi:hypothetical protein